MIDVAVAGPARMRRTRSDERRHVVPAPSEDGHGSKIPSECRAGGFVWSTAPCVAILRTYRGCKPHRLTDFLSG